MAQSKESKLRKSRFDIGAYLKEAREARDITLDEAASKTRLRTAYIKAIETNDFEALPSAIYKRAYIKSYAEYLEVEVKKVLDHFERQQAHQDFEEEEEEEEEVVSVPMERSFSPSGSVVFVSIMLAVMVYSAWHWQDHWLPHVAVSQQARSGVTTHEQKVIGAFTAPAPEISILAVEGASLRIENLSNDVLFEKEMKYGDVYIAPSQENILLKTDNIGALEIYVEGNTVASLDNIERQDEKLVLDINKLLANVVIQ